MITLITGNPGAGKSAAAVELMQQMADAGRPLYVNGIPDLTVPHEALRDDEAASWHTVVPDGAVIVIDEVQRIWRPRSSGSKVPEAVQALETHRHRGIDFLLVTQKARLLDVNVRALVGRHVHLRDLGILGRRWYEAPEVVEDCDHKRFPDSRPFKVPKASFSLYRSATIHTKPVRRVPRALIVAVVAGVAALSVGGYAVHTIAGRLEPVAPAPASNPLDAKVASVQAPVPAAPAAPAASAAGAAPAVPDVAEAAPVVAVGCIATPNRCICVDREGRTIVGLEWELCQRSARSYGGLVPLALDGGKAPPAVARPAAEGIPAPVGAYGFHAGDFRERPPGPHIRQGASF